VVRYSVTNPGPAIPSEGDQGRHPDEGVRAGCWLQAEGREAMIRDRQERAPGSGLYTVGRDTKGC
jgi:hypothetical protein